MLVITGMGRSGTSVLATFCKRLGFDPGGDYVEGINAGMEDPEVVAINEEILRPSRGDAVIADRFLERIRRLRRKVIKDPRFILAGGPALQAWWQQRQDLRILLAIRDPREVIRSRQAHPHWFGPIADAGAQELQEEVTATLWRMASQDMPFRCLRFPDFLKQPERVLDSLRFGGLSFSEARAKDQWQRLIDPAKVRHSPQWH